MTITSSLLGWIRSRLLYKVVVLYSLLTLIPLSVVSLAFYSRSQDLLERRSTEEAQQVLNRASSHVDDLLAAYAQELYQFSRNKLLHSYLMERVEPGKLEVKEALEEQLRYRLEEASATIGDYVDSLHLINGTETLFQIGDGYPLEYLRAFEIMPAEYDHTPQWAYFTDKNRMVCRLKLEDPVTGRQLGILVLALDTDKLTALYGNLELANFQLLNEDNLILSGTASERIGSLFSMKSNESVVKLIQKSRFSGLQYVYVADAKPAAIMKKQTLFSFYVTLFAWAGVILITYWLMRRITIPLTKLTRLMRRAGREEYVLMDEVSSRDEVALLCHGYNQMVNLTRELIEKNYKSELLKHEAELRSLQMYVNPHFLYNTLAYINVLSATPEGVRHIPDVNQRLTNILRFSISTGDNTVPLVKEMSIVEMYLQIHKYRYKDRLAYEIQLSPGFHSISIPKLLLQPLVENAIIHGVDRCAEGGKIRIIVDEDNFDLVITIENSIEDKETQNTVKSSLIPNRPGESKRGFGSGLKNVNDRIKYQYGASYGAVIALNDNYATVTVRLPIVIEGDE
jgi:two-component system sensor histidine kinase YesM